MTRLIFNPLLWALLAAVVAFMPQEAMEFVGLIDTRPGRWISP